MCPLKDGKTWLTGGVMADGAGSGASHTDKAAAAEGLAQAITYEAFVG